jgi:hypothetical protein
MNASQINKSRMYQAVNKVLESNLALYAGIEELVAAQGQLTNYLELIDSNRQVQEVNQTGLTNNKALLKERLTTQVMKVVAALAAHATATKDTVLLSRVNYRPSALQKPDPLLNDIARLILKEARNQEGALDKYFVLAGDLSELENLITLFKDAIPQKRVATNISKVSTLNIAGVFVAMDRLLKTETDILMMPFRFTQPDFYHAYKNARIIVNYTGRKKTQESAQLPAAQS